MADQRNNHTFFANRECKYYPCHSSADPENFNCLFATVPCTLWEISAEEISDTLTEELRIVHSVWSHIPKADMSIL